MVRQLLDNRGCLDILHLVKRVDGKRLYEADDSSIGQFISLQAEFGIDNMGQEAAQIPDRRLFTLNVESKDLGNVNLLENLAVGILQLGGDGPGILPGDDLVAEDKLRIEDRRDLAADPVAGLGRILDNPVARPPEILAKIVLHHPRLRSVAFTGHRLGHLNDGHMDRIELDLGLRRVGTRPRLLRKLVGRQLWNRRLLLFHPALGGLFILEGVYRTAWLQQHGRQRKRNKASAPARPAL